MNILIPMGGVGSRFSKEKYRFPKPLVNIVGRPMLLWIMDQLKTGPNDRLYIGVMESLDEQFGLMQRLKVEYNGRLHVEEVLLGFETRGAAETLFIMLQSMPEERLKYRTISLDCDTIYFSNVLQQFRDIGDGLNASFYFEDDGGKPIFSYLLFEGEHSISEACVGSPTPEDTESLSPVPASNTSSSRPAPRRVIDVREKIMISTHANTGAYAFASGEQLREYCIRILDQAVGASGEYYTTNLIRAMLSDGAKFVGLHVAKDEFVCVGTPIQLQEFLQTIKQQQMAKAMVKAAEKAQAGGHGHLAPPSLSPSPSPTSAQPATVTGREFASKTMRFCFDLDNTLVSYPTIPGDYRSCQPKMSNIRLVRELHAAGHKIIIQTARRMKTHNGNVGAVVRDIGQVTLESLTKFGIPFDELLFGKPYADVYVDDLAVHALIDTDKEVGWALADETDEMESIMQVPSIIPGPRSNSNAGTTTPNPSGSPRLAPSTPGGSNTSSGHSSKKSTAKPPAGFISPRHFNEIQETENTIIKSALTSSIRGELFYYQHIPVEVKDLFPALLRIDVGHVRVAGATGADAVQANDSGSDAGTISSLVISRIRGVTFSHLLVNRCLTDGRLIKLLKALQRLHQVAKEPTLTYTGSAAHPPPPELQSASVSSQPVNIYANYSSKLETRFQEWRAGYEVLDAQLLVEDSALGMNGVSSSTLKSSDLCAQLVQYLRGYETSKRGSHALMIHGDPVFSNVLLTSESSVVLLDMRGSLGDRLTTSGDRHYDLAKVLQSLHGYDIILLGKTNSTHASSVHPLQAPDSVRTYLSHLQTVFWDFVRVEYPEARPDDIRASVVALYFSLIPLHQKITHQLQFLRIAKDMWSQRISQSTK